MNPQLLLGMLKNSLGGAMGNAAGQAAQEMRNPNQPMNFFNPNVGGYNMGTFTDFFKRMFQPQPSAVGQAASNIFPTVGSYLNRTQDLSNQLGSSKML